MNKQEKLKLLIDAITYLKIAVDQLNQLVNEKLKDSINN